MITEWFVNLYSWFVQWVASVFGPWTPPAELTDASSTLNGILGGFASVGVWIDWGVLGACVLVQIGTWVAVVGIKLIRALLAHFPLFGGAGD